MDDAIERSLAHNEAIVRRINEAIERGTWPGEETKLGRFRCECSHVGCAEMLELSHEAYEQIRRSSRRFIVAPGHEIEGVDAVVDRRNGYLVVEKRGEAGEVAERSDPRD
jgi:hypothetical protein